MSPQVGSAVLPKNVTIFGSWYKCDDFVTSSHHFSGFGLEPNRVSKPGQFLDSGFMVFPAVCVPLRSYGKGTGIGILITQTQLWEREGNQDTS